MGENGLQTTPLNHCLVLNSFSSCMHQYATRHFSDVMHALFSGAMVPHTEKLPAPHRFISYLHPFISPDIEKRVQKDGHCRCTTPTPTVPCIHNISQFNYVSLNPVAQRAQVG